MLILATVSLPFMSLAISSSAGAIILHGPHHSAQKSTSTGPLAFRTSDSNDASLTCVVLAGSGLAWVVVFIPVFLLLCRPFLTGAPARSPRRSTSHWQRTLGWNLGLGTGPSRRGIGAMRV